MNRSRWTNTWTYRTLWALGAVAIASAIGIIFPAILGQPLPELLIVLGVIAASGLIKLLISPLNRNLLA